jgi:hypothetical protein
MCKTWGRDPDPDRHQYDADTQQWQLWYGTYRTWFEHAPKKRQLDVSKEQPVYKYGIFQVSTSAGASLAQWENTVVSPG